MNSMIIEIFNDGIIFLRKCHAFKKNMLFMALNGIKSGFW